MSQCCYNISCVYRYIPVRAYIVLLWLRFLWSHRPAMMIYRRANERTSARARALLCGDRRLDDDKYRTRSRRRSTAWRVGDGWGWEYANVCTCSSVHLYVYCILLYMHINAQTEKECKNKRTFRSCACACPPHKTYYSITATTTSPTTIKYKKYVIYRGARSAGVVQPRADIELRRRFRKSLQGNYIIICRPSSNTTHNNDDRRLIVNTYLHYIVIIPASD